ncbi:MAG TPA: AsnC family transcriptional regulator [Nitrososphaeraceae archaeon]|nr:AsnC family transcriptional regulator [Nitrososphaeraceae archaeon]
MPLQLDNYDVSILKSLLKDGRKSFREISRETGITTPTVKARFTRLVNVGFIRSVSPIFDFDMVEKENILKPALEEEQNKPTEDSSAKDENKKNNNNNKSRINQQQQDSSKIKKGLRIKLDCEFCKGPITSHPHAFRFANYERFFCCTGCMSGYKQKYAGRIESIKKKFAGDE